MPNPFRLPNRIEAAYRREMWKLTWNFLPEIGKDTTFYEWVDGLHAHSHFPQIANASAKLASRMVAQVNVQNAQSWREASARSQRSQMLYRLLRQELQGPVGQRIHQLASQNAELIRSVPQDVAQQLTREITKAQQQGARPETIAKMLRERGPELTQSKVNLIARTEVAKAASALTEARSEELGLDWFEWLTSEDQRVRWSHKNMDNVLVSWKDLPSPETLVHVKSSLGRYGPGQCPNCRCTPAPLLSLDDVSWPHRVYSGGRIIRMTRAQFAQLNGAPVRVAA